MTIIMERPTTPIVDLPLALILRKADFQIRQKLDSTWVQQLAAIFEQLPPVLVGRLPDTRLYLLGGFHRMEAAVSLGRLTIPASVVDCADENAAYELAVKDNATHGWPYKTKERKDAARGLLRRFTERSDRWIGEDCGLHNEEVGKLRKELELCDGIRHIEIRLGKRIREGQEQIYTYPCECIRCQPLAQEAATSEHENDESDLSASGQQAGEEANGGAAQLDLFTNASAEADADEDEDGPAGVTLADAEAMPTAVPERMAPAEVAIAPEPDPAPTVPPSRPGRVPKVAIVGSVIIQRRDARQLTKWVEPSVDLVITSPPYNVGTDYAQHDDALPPRAYFQLIRKVWRSCYEVMNDGARIAVVVPFGVDRNPWVPLAARVADTLTDAGFTLRGQIIWDKNTSGNLTSWGSFCLPTDPSLRDTSEAIIVAHKGSGKLKVPPDLIQHRRVGIDTEVSYTDWLADPARFMELAQDLWVVAPESAKRVRHPAPFPVALVERLAWFYAYPGAHLLDPFAGSGTVGVTALRLKCSADLFDIDASYCSIAIQRCEREYAKLSGQR